MAQATASDSLDVAVELANSLLQPVTHENDTKLMQEPGSSCTQWQSFRQEDNALNEIPVDSFVNQSLFELESSPANMALSTSDFMSFDSSSVNLFDYGWSQEKPLEWPQDKFFYGLAQQQEKQQSQPMPNWSSASGMNPQHTAISGYTTSMMPSASLSRNQQACMFGGAMSMIGDGKFLPPTPPVDTNTQPHAINWYETSGLIQHEPSPPLSVQAQTVNTPMQPCYFPNVTMAQQGMLRGNQPQRSYWNTRPRRQASPTSRPTRRRSSAHPSVASVVSLSAHEPVAHVIQGIPHITFLYSHDRLVKEYTVRTDVESCSLDDIPHDFRMHNVIYPRANVKQEDYDGNRWEYETSCNMLGWKLCWLNKEQLCGRRGLIQRAVDSYRNRHSEMRSRRVSRQEKVANGTLRRRRSKRT